MITKLNLLSTFWLVASTLLVQHAALGEDKKKVYPWEDDYDETNTDLLPKDDPPLLNTLPPVALTTQALPPPAPTTIPPLPVPGTTKAPSPIPSTTPAPAPKPKPQLQIPSPPAPQIFPPFYPFPTNRPQGSALRPRPRPRPPIQGDPCWDLPLLSRIRCHRRNRKSRVLDSIF